MDPKAVVLDDITLNTYRVIANREHEGQGAGSFFQLTAKDAQPFLDKLELVEEGSGTKEIVVKTEVINTTTVTPKTLTAFEETVNSGKLQKKKAIDE